MSTRLSIKPAIRRMIADQTGINRVSNTALEESVQYFKDIVTHIATLACKIAASNNSVRKVYSRDVVSAYNEKVVNRRSTTRIKKCPATAVGQLDACHYISRTSYMKVIVPIAKRYELVWTDEAVDVLIINVENQMVKAYEFAEEMLKQYGDKKTLQLKEVSLIRHTGLCD